MWLSQPSHITPLPLYLPKAAPRSPRTRWRSFLRDRRSGHIWTFPRPGVTAPSSWAASGEAQDSRIPVTVKIKARASSSHRPGIVASRVKDSGNKGECTVGLWGHTLTPPRTGLPATCLVHLSLSQFSWSTRVAKPGGGGNPSVPDIQSWGSQRCVWD